MKRKFAQGQTGFTLVELLAVMAILAVLAGLVATTVAGLGSRGQIAQLDGDLNSITKGANSFFTEAFPPVYPVLTEGVTGNVAGIFELDFKAGLPQDPNRSFVPDFLLNLPNSAALVKWRIDTKTGRVFFAQDGSPLIKPSNLVVWPRVPNPTTVPATSPASMPRMAMTASSSTKVNPVCPFTICLCMSFPLRCPRDS